MSPLPILNMDSVSAPINPRTPPAVPRTATSLLMSARQIQEDRAATYDQPDGERSMAKTVQMFNVATGHELRESDGWLFQQLLKIVRDQSRIEAHIDSCEDNVSYASLYGEARLAGR